MGALDALDAIRGRGGAVADAGASAQSRAAKVGATTIGVKTIGVNLRHLRANRPK